VKVHNYFSVIDSEYKAYILGLIYADGCLVAPFNNRQGRLSIAMQLEDGYILEKLRMDIVGKSFIVKHSPNQQKAGEKKQAVVNISSQEIFNTLVTIGCPPNKTVVGMTFPILDTSLMHHFIRGFFDGDGCITVDFPRNKYVSRITGKRLRDRKPVRGRIAFTGTDLEFLNTIVSYLPCTTHRIVSVVKRQRIYTIWIERQKDVIQCMQYLYQDAQYYLTRKKLKVDMLISSQAESTLSEGSETTGALKCA
jgi:hypothetical protein